MHAVLTRAQARSGKNDLSTRPDPVSRGVDRGHWLPAPEGDAAPGTTPQAIRSPEPPEGSVL